MFCLVKTGYLGFIHKHLSAVENQSLWVFWRTKGYFQPFTRAAAEKQCWKHWAMGVAGEAKSLQINYVLVLLTKEVFPLGMRRANGTTLHDKLRLWDRSGFYHEQTAWHIFIVEWSSEIKGKIGCLGGKITLFSLGFTFWLPSGQKWPLSFSKHHRGMEWEEEDEMLPPVEPGTLLVLLQYLLCGSLCEIAGWFYWTHWLGTLHSP